MMIENIFVMRNEKKKIAMVIGAGYPEIILNLKYKKRF